MTEKPDCRTRRTFTEWLGYPVERNVKVILSEGVHIEPDLYSKENKTVCEIFAHIDSLKVGRQHKISQDILKMLLLEKSMSVTYRRRRGYV